MKRALLIDNEKIKSPMAARPNDLTKARLAGGFQVAPIGTLILGASEWLNEFQSRDSIKGCEVSALVFNVDVKETSGELAIANSAVGPPGSRCDQVPRVRSSTPARERPQIRSRQAGRQCQTGLG